MRFYGPGHTPSDYFFWVADSARDRFHQLPAPLPWIEPSINMPYLQSCASFVLAQNLSSILLSGVLLEHTLRLAVIDKVSGTLGSMDKKAWEKYSWYTISDFIKKESAVLKGLIDDKDLPWWEDFAAKVVRNKTAHLDVPEIIKHLNHGRLEEYLKDYKDSHDEAMIYSNRFYWGAMFHKRDALIAVGFLKEVTKNLSSLIAKVGWQPNRDHWASQEHYYNSFFSYAWTREAMIASVDGLPRDFTLAEIEAGKHLTGDNKL